MSQLQRYAGITGALKKGLSRLMKAGHASASSRASISLAELGVSKARLRKAYAMKGAYWPL